MLLTITTTHQPATDLGFLLAKHPDRLQSFSLAYGTAHVFYPEASEERCTAALLLDVDPIGLVRSQKSRFKGGSTLAQYVNDRPYAASSFPSVAIGTSPSAPVSSSFTNTPNRATPEIRPVNSLPTRSAR